MSIKSTTLVLAIAATLVTTPVLIVLAPQLTYAQQGPSTNSNFQEFFHPAPPKYFIKIPTDWKGPGDNSFGDLWYQSPDQSQYVQMSRRFPGMDSLQNWVNAEIQDLASKGKRPDRDVSTTWQGIHPTRILMYPDHISIWIEAYTRFYNIRAAGAVINGQTINPTTLQILNSFRIQEPTLEEFRQIGRENENFMCLIRLKLGLPCVLLGQSTTTSNNDTQVLQAPLPNSSSQQPPQALDQGVETTLNTPVNITLQASDANPTDKLTATIVSQPMNGTLSEINQETGTVSYTPNPGTTGQDSFTFSVNDGSADSINNATAFIIVNSGGSGTGAPAAPTGIPTPTNTTEKPGQLGEPGRRISPPLGTIEPPKSPTIPTPTRPTEPGTTTTKPGTQPPPDTGTGSTTSPLTTSPGQPPAAGPGDPPLGTPIKTFAPAQDGTCKAPAKLQGDKCTLPAEWRYFSKNQKPDIGIAANGDITKRVPGLSSPVTICPAFQFPRTPLSSDRPGDRIPSLPLSCKILDVPDGGVVIGFDASAFDISGLPPGATGPPGQLSPACPDGHQQIPGCIPGPPLPGQPVTPLLQGTGTGIGTGTGTTPPTPPTAPGTSGPVAPTDEASCKAANGTWIPGDDAGPGECIIDPTQPPPGPTGTTPPGPTGPEPAPLPSSIITSITSKADCEGRNHIWLEAEGQCMIGCSPDSFDAQAETCPSGSSSPQAPPPTGEPSQEELDCLAQEGAVWIPNPDGDGGKCNVPDPGAAPPAPAPGGGAPPAPSATNPPIVAPDARTAPPTTGGLTDDDCPDGMVANEDGTACVCDEDLVPDPSGAEGCVDPGGIDTGGSGDATTQGTPSGGGDPAADCDPDTEFWDGTECKKLDTGSSGSTTSGGDDPVAGQDVLEFEEDE
jgi:Bacterial Ig domain